MATTVAARVRRALLAIDGVLTGGNTFGDGEAFWVNGKQIAHFRAIDQLELRLTRAVIRAERERLQADGQVTLRISSASDWIMVRFSSTEDVAFIAELALKAAAAHRPAGRVTAKPPPTGADLERRRRFH